MKLFEVIPEKFFSILSSPLKEIYTDGLFLLFEQYRAHTSFGINREVFTQILTDYFEDMGEEQLFEEEGETGRSARDKANFFIRKLEECKWITIEFTSGYTQMVNLNDYAVAILETLEKILTNEKLEYQGYVYTIYSILFGSENNQYNILLEQVHENTGKLINGLKVLNSNIKRYIEKITEKKTTEEILKLHFEGYSHDVVDKGYHRLKTSDHVSKFRPRILEKLEEIRRNTEYIQAACRLEVEMERASSLDEAKETVLRKLVDTINAFTNMDSIIHEIDRKNNQYIRASLTRIKYLLNSSKDVGGQITDILKTMIGMMETLQTNLKEEPSEWVAELYQVFPQSFIDEKSLYTASEGKRTFIPQNLIEENSLSREERERLIRKIREKKETRMNRENIDRYILELLKDKITIKASQLVIESISDFIRLIYILVYSRSRLVHFKIKREKVWIERNGFAFQDFEIWRK